MERASSAAARRMAEQHEAEVRAARSQVEEEHRGRRGEMLTDGIRGGRVWTSSHQCPEIKPICTHVQIWRVEPAGTRMALLMTWGRGRQRRAGGDERVTVDSCVALPQELIKGNEQVISFGIWSDVNVRMCEGGTMRPHRVFAKKQ